MARRPTRYRAANLAWQLGGDVALVRKLAESADVLGLVECRDVRNEPIDVAKVLGPGWDTAQDLSSAARAGSVVAVRRTPDLTLRWSRLTLASPAGPKVQDRYLRVAHIIDHGRPTRIGVIHPPLRSTGRQDDAVRTARAWVSRMRAVRVVRPRLRWLLAGDFNMAPAAMARLVGAPHHGGEGVLGICWSGGWGSSWVRADHLPGSDHAVLTFREVKP